MGNNTKEPTLAEYGLDTFSYKDYRTQKNSLEELLDKFVNNIKHSVSYVLCSVLSVVAALAILMGVIVVFIIAINFVRYIFGEPLPSDLFDVGWLYVFFLLIGIIFHNVCASVLEELDQKIETEKERTYVEIKNLGNGILQFEEASVKYYENYLVQFFQNNLYKKRSGNERFEQSLNEFSSMIDEVKEINEKLIFKHRNKVYLSSHEVYLSGREGDHELQKNKEKPIFRAFDGVKVIDEKTESLKEIKPQVAVVPTIAKETKANLNKEESEAYWDSLQQKKEVAPSEKVEEVLARMTAEVSRVNNAPHEQATSIEKEIVTLIPLEKKYRTARKIDNYDELNRRKASSGRQGEEIILLLEKDYFRASGREDIVQKIRHVSVEDGDGLGYDILSFFDDGREKYIEVKSTVGSVKTPFDMSLNELSFLKEHSDDAFVYRVSLPNEDGVSGELEIKSSADVFDGEITATSFRVRV